MLSDKGVLICAEDIIQFYDFPIVTSQKWTFYDQAKCKIFIKDLLKPQNFDQKFSPGRVGIEKTQIHLSFKGSSSSDEIVN